MQQRIRREDLRPGMYVVSHGKGTFDSPLVAVERCVLSPAAIAELIPVDAAEVLVDTDKAVVIGGVSLADELPVAKRLYTEALGHARRFVDDVRKGKSVDYHEAEPLVDGFIESVFRNEAAAVTLFKLRRFDEYTYTHSINVSILAVLLGKHLGMDRETLRNLGIAGVFHDIGKARIPESILNKPGKLTESEFAAMKSHPLEGFKLMRTQPGLNPEILRAVVEHHERHDGSGYPRGIKKDEIGRFSRVISVVDVYDALTSKRVYKDAVAPAKALGMMYQWRDRDFTPHSIDSFIKCLGVFPTGSFVRLSSGEHGIVSSANPDSPTKPEVKIVLDAKMRPMPARTVDLREAGGQVLSIAEVLDPSEFGLDLSLLLSS